MIKKKLIIANWKMNPRSSKEAEKLFSNTVKNVSNLKKTEVIICPPFVYLDKLKKISRKFSIGAQNIFWVEKGAYTGEISAEMLDSIGVKYVLLGHSERRALGENNSDINKKIKAALSAGIISIICIGEKERDENHEYFNIIKTQILECLNGISKNLISKIVIAYEPVWSISTTINRKDETPEDFFEMSIFIRKVLADKFGIKTEMPRIIYGGSVNEKNVSDFIKNKGVDGVLVGNASLYPEKFSEIIKICEALEK
ncbi:MAG: triose-phosphate isomerase [Candidatus Paceibacterota bacterium]|jgi:triosephosphate isomerase